MANCKQMLMGGGKPQTPKVRDERIDSVKYWLIVLVIAGHVFKRPEFADSTACVTLWKWIYIFHMPLFIFISGYFSQKKDWKYLWPSICKLLEPLIIFQAIVILLYHHPISFSKILLWYLLSLIYWRLMLQIIPDRILNNEKLILINTFIISIIAGFLPFNTFLSIQRTFAFMPFFFLGYYMKRKNICLMDKYKLLSLSFLILTFFIPLLFPQYLGSLTHAAPYDNIYDAVKRIIVFALAIPMSIAFINVCPNILWSARQGRFTIHYYIYHILAIPPLMVIVSKLNIPMSFVSATIYTILITIGIGIVLRFPYFDKFINPSSFFSR